ncbi:MAG TPA: bifunctional adenosylcobinamide kinase/adenosylcobinamide-phosphate guanylyltransferase [Hyphomicrobiaceae bacterium]|nr:bifunctional adenosylcobinamide kinase/adenosylcobinamide-phosphate guanylyltransferase [Hyphomicrobiaceae bacterium]
MLNTTSHLIIGGARSGKTRHALALAESCPRRVYIATAEAWDGEMLARIQAHQRERDASWTTVEEPIDITRSLRTVDKPDTAIVIDCLTLWLNNLMTRNLDIDAATSALVAALGRPAGTIILVTNEVGLGIVPENALARRFRDAQGRLNQQIAAAATHVDFVAAGLTLSMKRPGNPMRS